MLPSTLNTATSLPATVKRLPVPGGTCSSRATSTKSAIVGASNISLFSAFQFLSKNWHPEIAGLHALHHAKLQHLHDFLHGRACLERPLDVPSCAGSVHVRVGRIEGDAQKLNLLRREYAAGVDGDSGGHELVGPRGVEFDERVPRRIPLTRRPHLVAC